jgi:hypothetical protein
VACLGAALGIMGSSLIDAQEQAVQMSEECHKHTVMTLFDSQNDNEPHDHEHHDATNEAAKLSQEENSQDCHLHQREVPLWKNPTFRMFHVYLVLLVSVASLFGYSNGWGVESTLYCLVITGKLRVMLGDAHTQTHKTVGQYYVYYVHDIFSHHT